MEYYDLGFPPGLEDIIVLVSALTTDTYCCYCDVHATIDYQQPTPNQLVSRFPRAPLVATMDAKHLKISQVATA